MTLPFSVRRPTSLRALLRTRNGAPEPSAQDAQTGDLTTPERAHAPGLTVKGLAMEREVGGPIYYGPSVPSRQGREWGTPSYRPRPRRCIVALPCRWT